MPYLAAGAGFLVVAVALRLDRRHRLDRAPAWAVLALALVAAGGAAVADGAPTLVEPVDVGLRVLLAVVLVAAGAVVHRFVPLLATAVLAVGLVFAGSPALWAAGLALGLAAGGAVADRRLPLVGAAVGGLVAQVVLRLEWPVATGASLALGALVAAVLVVPALGRVPERAARPVWAAVALVVVVAGAGAVGGMVAGASALDDLQAAADGADRGLDLVAEDAAAARSELEASAARFSAAGADLDAPWARLASAVPLVSQQVRAARTMATSGEDLAGIAARSVAEADLSAIRAVGGDVDLVALAGFAEPLERARTALAAARPRLDEAASPWLLGPVADELDGLRDRLVDAEGSAALAAQVVDVLPGMLGADGPRRYLLLVQQTAETRGSGGFPGNFGEIVADGGRLDLVRFGRNDQLRREGVPEAERMLAMPAAYDALYGYEPYLRGWQNLTFAPDFPVVAELARQLYPQSGGAELHGVISVDPTALAALLRVVGGVGLGQGRGRLTADNAVERLAFQQYVDYDTEVGKGGRFERIERIDLLGDAAELTWGRIEGGELPRPRVLARRFGPAVEGRHLQVVAFDPDERALLERFGMTGALPEPEVDGVGFALQNVGQNKIDWFVDRSAAYDVAWDPATGEVAGTYSVSIRNDAPADGLPDFIIGWNGEPDVDYRTARGESLSLVYLYTALPPTGPVTGDGVELVGDTQRDGRWYVTPARVRVPAGTTATVTLDVAGSVAPGGPWSLATVRSPSLHGDELTVSVDAAGGATPVGDGWADDGGGVRSTTRSLEAPVALTVRPGS